MKHTLVIIAAAGLVCSLSSDVSALTISDPGVVGAVDGLSGDRPADDAAWLAQGILDLAFGATVESGGRTWWSSHTADYSGTIIGKGIKYDSTPSVPAGYEYALAKYNGKNAGWVLFYLGGLATTLPRYSSTIWGTGTQYQISNFTVFNPFTPTSPPAAVPDRGSAAVLLGSALLGLGLLRRRFGRS